MIHCTWGRGSFWHNYISYFSERGYQCLAPDWLYHDQVPGVPPDPRLGTTSLLDFVADFENQILQLEKKPIIMGHSVGGLMAQILASRGVGKAAVAITSGVPAGINAFTPSVLWSFKSVTGRWGFWRKPHKQTFKEAVYSMMHLMPKEAQIRFYDELVYDSGRATSEIGFWYLDPQKASRVDEKKVTCPFLVIGAGKDRITPVSTSRKIAKKYPHADYKEYENHAHWILHEPGWETVAQDIYFWLQEKKG
ncbi:MAG: alpha/beta fold hydrolase [Thermodesulfobacteriota bacterium]|nr:alpha/beta fold hydrolase [Thermodesulfobacteriota bacterium]